MALEFSRPNVNELYRLSIQHTLCQLGMVQFCVINLLQGSWPASLNTLNIMLQIQSQVKYGKWQNDLVKSSV